MKRQALRRVQFGPGVTSEKQAAGMDACRACRRKLGIPP